MSFQKRKKNLTKVLKGLGFVLLIYGVILIVGAVLGNSDPFRPWEGSKIVATKGFSFSTIKSMDNLNDRLAAAKRGQQIVLIDFYADWCSSCIRLEQDVFSKSTVQNALTNFVLLKADITKNDAFDHALLKRFNVIAPPTILFFDPNGDELINARLVGETNEKSFLTHIQQLNLIEE